MHLPVGDSQPGFEEFSGFLSVRPDLASESGRPEIRPSGAALGTPCASESLLGDRRWGACLLEPMGLSPQLGRPAFPTDQRASNREPTRNGRKPVTKGWPHPVHTAMTVGPEGPTLPSLSTLSHSFWPSGHLLMIVCLHCHFT